MRKSIAILVLLMSAILPAMSAQAALWEETSTITGQFFHHDEYSVDLTSIGLSDGSDYVFSLTLTTGDNSWEDSGQYTDFVFLTSRDSSGAVTESVNYSDIAGALTTVTRTFQFTYDAGVDASLVSYMENNANTVEYWTFNAASISAVPGSAGCIPNTPIPGAVWLLGSGFLGLAGFRRKLLS